MRDGKGEGGIDHLLSRWELCLQGIVLRIAEYELVSLAEIDGAGVCIRELPGGGEYALKEHVQVLDLQYLLSDVQYLVKAVFARVHIGLLCCVLNLTEDAGKCQLFKQSLC